MLTLHRLSSTARGRRRELGLSQSELATRIGASRNLVRRFEAAEGTTSIAAVLRILDVLGLSLDFVRVGGSESRPGTLTLDAVIADLKRS